MDTITFTKTAPPEWLLAMWKEIDEKTFGKGFDCFKVFHGKVGMKFDDPSIKPVRPTMTHFFYMDEKAPTKVKHWIGSVGPTGF